MAVAPELLQTALDIVVRAGEIQLARAGRGLRVGKKGPIDLVTEVDVEIERMCRDTLAERYPTHAVLAEELPNPAAGAVARGGCRWIFDPLDGTVNYAHGVPIFCASLALEVAGRVEVGAVYDPSRQELFVGEREGGARLNGAPLAVSPAAELIDAMLCTGFPYDVHETVDEVVGLFAEFVRRARAVRRLGSAALDLCYVAAGRLDGFWEQRLRPWDTAAGALIVAEAGGRVTNLDGAPFTPFDGGVLASNGRLHDPLLAVVRGCAAARSRNRTD